MHPIIQKLWFITFGIALLLLISIGLFPLGSYPLLGLAGLVWLVIGGMITFFCLVWSYRKRWWSAFRLHLSSVVFAMLSLIAGISEFRATEQFGLNYLSPSRFYIVRTYGSGDSGTSPYHAQIKWTFVPFFSLFSREIFIGDCDNFHVEWRSNKLLHISCLRSTNIQFKRKEALGISIEYELSQ